MIPLDRRAEMLCMQALLNDDELMSVYERQQIYQGYVEPNTLASYDRYILVKRISAISEAKTTTGEGADMLRRVRLQIDILDTRYSDMVRYSELVCKVLNEYFPSCIEGDTYGTDGRGQKVFNACSLDVIIYESAED